MEICFKWAISVVNIILQFILKPKNHHPFGDESIIIVVLLIKVNRCYKYYRITPVPVLNKIIHFKFGYDNTSPFEYQSSSFVKKFNVKSPGRWQGPQAVICIYLWVHNFIILCLQMPESDMFSTKFLWIIQRAPVTHLCVTKTCHHWFRWWLVAFSASSHYLNQYWLIVNWTTAYYFSEIWIKIPDFSLKKKILKKSSAARRPIWSWRHSTLPTRWHYQLDPWEYTSAKFRLRLLDPSKRLWTDT